jgi:predicted AAA+ superfamily ATPase
MLSTPLQNRILQLNPWLTRPESADGFMDRTIPKPYVPRQLAAVPGKKNRAVIIVGPRQAGKSTYVWHRLRDDW